MPYDDQEGIFMLVVNTEERMKWISEQCPAQYPSQEILLASNNGYKRLLEIRGKYYKRKEIFPDIRLALLRGWPFLLDIS